MLTPAPTRVLIADDHELVRRGLRLVLEAEDDMEVVGEAEDGVQAVEATEQLAPDVVLLDLRMPVLGGIAACERIRAACPDVRVVILTSFDDAAEVVAALKAGACSYLLKDTSPDALVQSLRGVCNGNTVLDPAVAGHLIAHHTPAAEVLSARELEVLRYMALGYKNREIAQTMWISENTVKTHVAHVISKLGQRDRTQAVVVAIKKGLIEVVKD